MEAVFQITLSVFLMLLTYTLVLFVYLFFIAFIRVIISPLFIEDYYFEEEVGGLLSKGIFCGKIFLISCVMYFYFSIFIR
ncbi:hypothetical protein C0583_02230 [Candidatus Parcubacteria bacterium]|nr:MAG: hypothetical protein C0583_02230 [Candidatus Parcubacteria bacterium]